jgi:hypothetical protein
VDGPSKGKTPGRDETRAVADLRPEEPPVLVPTLIASKEGEAGSTPETPPLGGKSGQVPFHPSAAALLVVVDNLWALEDWLVLTWILTIPLSFLTVAVPTYWLQRRFRQDSRMTALLKALFFGVVAAVPTSVTGTPIGLALLAWAGVRRG